MSHVLRVSAEPGEHVNVTAQAAIDMAATYRAPVEMSHNNRVVNVQPGDDIALVLNRWKRLDAETQQQHAIGCVWVAYYVDWSNLAIFADELEAHRYASRREMAVTKWPFGADAHEATR